MELLRYGLWALETCRQIICWKKWLNLCSLSSFVLFDSFISYVLGPIPGSGDIVVNEIGKNPCYQKAYILGGGSR